MKRIALAVLVGAVGALTGTAVADARVRYASELVFTDYSYDTPADILFYGYLTSPGPRKCSVDRKVELFYETDGPDARVGSTRTDSFEHWHLFRPTEGLPDADDYYARVGKRKLRNGDVCRAGRSEAIPID
jgi:hypothetical protein